TEVYVPMDVNQSPFNVGFSVELPEFTIEQVQDLAQRHQLNWSVTEVRQLMAMVGGHPFLVRLALYNIARQHITLTQLLQTVLTDGGIYSDYLRRLELMLAEQPELGIAMREVVTSSSSVRLKTVPKFKLQGIGLVKLQGDEVIPSCELYRQYFQNH
ncbi:MAG: AAA-like domain-containing protein, partial [Rhizonema sp. PD38]|nr:AAA-like domain-containing protein [Rhizonema sp. PD38]